MSQNQLDIVILGLSITSSWGNGHATTYRGLVKELTKQGHRVQFLERDVPWYAENRDLPNPDFVDTRLYRSREQLIDEHAKRIRNADAVIVGSYVPEGIEIGQLVTQEARGVTAFYDIDTPVTLANLHRNACEYLSAELIARYDVYLSFTGGPTLDLLREKYGSPCPRVLYCSVDPDLYHPMEIDRQWDLGYMGTYSQDRQPGLEELMIESARRWPGGRYVVAGPQYPANLDWPPNVQRIEHLSPSEHCHFYNSQNFTLNITRADMQAAGYCPSVRLFEAAACGTPIISDYWNGLEELFDLSSEILVSRSRFDTQRILMNTHNEKRLEPGQRARQRVLERHTAAHRAAELVSYLTSARDSRVMAKLRK